MLYIFLYQYFTALVFGYDVPVKFTIDGDAAAIVHITGYYQPGPDDDDNDEEDEDDDYEFDDEDDEETAEAYKKLVAGKKGMAIKNSKCHILILLFLYIFKTFLFHY